MLIMSKTTIIFTITLPAFQPLLDLTVIENFMKVDPQYLNATFAVNYKRYGGMEKFIQSELGFDTVSRQAIIAKFTYQP
jgi:protein-tyrosine phosphatase